MKRRGRSIEEQWLIFLKPNYISSQSSANGCERMCLLSLSLPKQIITYLLTICSTRYVLLSRRKNHPNSHLYITSCYIIKDIILINFTTKLKAFNDKKTKLQATYLRLMLSLDLNYCVLVFSHTRAETRYKYQQNQAFADNKPLSVFLAVTNEGGIEILKGFCKKRARERVMQQLKRFSGGVRLLSPTNCFRQHDFRRFGKFLNYKVAVTQKKYKQLLM